MQQRCVEATAPSSDNDDRNTSHRSIELAWVRNHDAPTESTGPSRPEQRRADSQQLSDQRSFHINSQDSSAVLFQNKWCLRFAYRPPFRCIKCRFDDALGPGHRTAPDLSCHSDSVIRLRVRSSPGCGGAKTTSAKMPGHLASLIAGLGESSTIPAEDGTLPHPAKLRLRLRDRWKIKGKCSRTDPGLCRAMTQ